jgi:hypothetical protein
MPLTKAVAIGAVAALAVPYALSDLGGRTGDAIRAGLVHIDLGSLQLGWSWTIFAIVTLLAWGALAWASR